MKPDWWSYGVEALVRGILDDRAYDRLPMLADAMEDAGCVDDRLLRIFRADEPARSSKKLESGFFMATNYWKRIVLVRLWAEGTGDNFTWPSSGEIMGYEGGIPWP